MKLAFVFLALVLLLTVSSAYFPRPYENESWVVANPNIYYLGKAYWWNLGEFQDSLDSADYPAISRLPLEEPARGHISNAMQKAAEARNDLSTCQAEAFLALGYLPTQPMMSYLLALSNSSACMAYPSAWKSSLDSDLMALEDSVEASVNAESEARGQFERAVFMGICNSNYTGPGSGDCVLLESAFLSIDSGIAEGDYGKTALITQYSGELESSLMSPSPDLGKSASIMGLIWGSQGSIQSFRELEAKADRSSASAGQHYLELLETASANKAVAGSWLTSLKSEEIGRITRGASVLLPGELGSVAERYTSLLDSQRQADALLTETKAQYGRKSEHGYLARSIALAESAGGGYGEISDNAESLLDSARDAVDSQRDAAESEIARTEKEFQASPPGKNASVILDEARAAFSSAEGPSTLGKKFERYSAAAALARLARNADSLGTELNFSATRVELESLIGRAEKDGINVASEKENLKLIALLPMSQATAAMQESIGSIESKARVKYESELMARRANISEQISLAGPSAADLNTEMAECEDGIFEDGALLLPGSIGRLRKLSSEYTEIEAILAEYASDTIGNSMSISADPLIPLARLDEPSEIILDAVMPNSRAYGGTKISARILMSEPFDFLYSDIARGREGVESIRSENGGKTIAVLFASVAPFETTRVVFNKMGTIAHTTKITRLAQGIGNGRAMVTERIEFSLDHGVTDIEMPADSASFSIDGRDSPGFIKIGKHTAVSERIIEDAYSESVQNIKAYPVGINSLVEYDVRIHPSMDLDDVRVLLYSMNDSSASSFEVTCATGEGIRERVRTSNTSYTLLLTGLKNGREAVLKVRYRVEDTESYVEGRLSAIEGLDMGPSANILLNQAKNQASAGNYSEALALIEGAVARAHEDEKLNAKLQSQSESIEKRLMEELGEIISALDGVNSPSPFIMTLASRKTELERALSESNASNLSDRIAVLEKIDATWLGKQVASQKKELYVRYNGLRERLYSAGNSSTPEEFLAFEEAFRQLEAGGRLEYCVDAIERLDTAEHLVVGLEALSESNEAGARARFESLKTETLDAFERYSRQASAAKGTDYSSMFTETEKRVNSLVSDAEDAIRQDPRMFQSKMAELNGSHRRMEASLEALKNESEARTSMIGSVISSKTMPPEKKASLEAKLDSIRKMGMAGDYVNALRAQSSLTKELDALEEPEGNGTLVLGVTGMALLAGIGFYIVKKPKEKKETRRLATFSPGPRIQSRAGSTPSQEGPGHSSRSSQPPGRHQQPAPEDSTS